MGNSIDAAHDPSAPSGHLPALRAGRNLRCVHTIDVVTGSAILTLYLALIGLSAEWRRSIRSIVVRLSPRGAEPPRSLLGHHTTPAARSSATCSAVIPRTDERTRWVSSP